MLIKSKVLNSIIVLNPNKIIRAISEQDITFNTSAHVTSVIATEQQRPLVLRAEGKGLLDH